MTAPEKTVRMAAQLDEARDTAKQLHGPNYTAKMAEYGKFISQVATGLKIDPVAAAIRLAKEAQADGNPFTAVCLLAAAVELAETSQNGATR